MIANELRIGNYLLQYGEVGKIVEIGIKHKGDTNYYLRSENDNCGYWIDQFKPISLTEEILLKCGFKITKNDEYPFKYVINKGMRDEIEIEDLNSTTCFVLSHGRRFSVVKIKYLHQLQNLYFALTGKELEIEL